ncbi:hypothetical protein ACWDSD_37600 [Streptomyces spiralis]
MGIPEVGDSETIPEFGDGVQPDDSDASNRGVVIAAALNIENFNYQFQSMRESP